jgi:hypothetical protein
MRFRIVLAAALATLALGAIGVPAASASSSGNGSQNVVNIPALKTVKVHGKAKNGKTFTGTYGIQRFVVANRNGHKGVYSIGTLQGTLNHRHITRYGVMMPASLTDPSGSPAAARSAAATCTILHLVLGPINLSLLGLNVNLGGGDITPGQPAQQPITLNLTGTQGGGLLGDLLCGLDNALGGSTGLGGLLSGLSSQLSNLAATLNGLVALL